MDKIANVAGNDLRGAQSIETISNWKLQPLLIVADKAMELLSTVTKFIERMQQAYYEYKRNRVVESIDKIHEMIIHRTLLKGLRKLGLGEEWLKLVLNEQENFIWLKDVEGIYVAINDKMFKELGFEKYTQILGTDSTTAANFVSDNNKYKKALGENHMTDSIVLKEGYTIVNMTKISDLTVNDGDEEDEHLKIFKYAIKNQGGDIIAIFGIGKIVSDSYAGLESIDNPEQKIMDLLRIVEKETK